MELNEKEKKEKPDNDQRVIFSQMENVICKLSAWQILKCLMISFNLQKVDGNGNRKKYWAIVF